MGLFKKKSADDKLRDQKYQKFAEIEEMFAGDGAQVIKFQSNWLSARARHLLGEGDVDRALIDFEDALRLDGKNILSIMSYVGALQHLDRVDESESLFADVDEDKELDEDPISLFHYYVMWGRVLAVNEKYPEAFSKLKSALKVSTEKTKIKKYTDLVQQMQDAGAEMDPQSFDISVEVEEVREMMNEIKRLHKQGNKPSKAHTKQPKSNNSSKLVTLDAVSNEFVSVFIEVINQRREEFLDLLKDKQTGSKLIVDPDKAKLMLFYNFLMYWTLPVFNLFDQKLANNLFDDICSKISDAYGADAEHLNQLVRDMRDYYEATYVENAQRMKGSDWILEGLVEDSGMFLNLKVDGFMLDSLPFNWKALSEEFTIK